MRTPFRTYFGGFLRAALATLVAAGCDSSGPGGPAPVEEIVITAPAASPSAGSALALRATTRDARGAVLTGRTVTWTSGSTAIATIDATGLLSALTDGATTVTATSEGRKASLVVVVVPMPVATVQLSPSSATVIAGSVVQLAAVTLGLGGAVLPGRAVAWRSDNSAIASVDANGLITGVSAGVVTVTAESEGVRGTASIDVASATPPEIASVTPTTLSAGVTATINGAGFDPLPANNVVTIGGANAPVILASLSQLTVSVPCVQSGPTTVQVRTRGAPSPVVAASMTGVSRSLAVGQSLVLTASATSVCNELRTSSPTARYLVTVFSAATSANTLVDFDFGGNTPTSGTVAAVGYPSTMRAGFATAMDAAPAGSSQAGHDDGAHWAMLERNRADYERLRAVARSLPPERAVARAVEAPAVGDKRSLYFTFSGGCSDTTRVIRGTAIYAGTRAIIWEDSANALQSSLDAPLADYYRRLGEIFDTDQYESVKRTFGDPLLRDAVTDGDGRVHMVFSQRLNNSGAAAYVTACDLFARTSSPGSNFGQFFYGSVPTSSSSNLSSNASSDGWFNFMTRTVVHETKHITSFAARVANNAPSFETSWLEEGTARHAEEMWVRESLHHSTWKGNNTFGTAATNGLYCDFHPSEPLCLSVDPLRRPSFGMRRHFNEIREKLVQPWNYSPYGDGIGQSGATFYQTAWSLVRYTIDRYAASDAAFFSALVNSSTSGVTNLSAVAGVPMDQLIGGWGLALFADDYPGLASPSSDMQFPSWNLRSIYAGLNASSAWTGRFTSPYPLQPVQLAFGSFSSRVTAMRGGAHAFFEISGTTLPVQLLALRSPAGGVPSPLLRIAIARLQ